MAAAAAARCADPLVQGLVRPVGDFVETTFDAVSNLFRRRIDEADETSEQRAERHALQRLLFHKEHQAVSRWRAVVNARRDALSTMRRCLIALVHTKLQAGYRGWRDIAMARKAKAQKMRRAIQKIVNSGASRGFNRWHAVVVEAKAAKHRLACLMKRASPEGQALMKAFDSFHEMMKEARRARRAMAAFSNRDVHKAFNSWLRLVDSQRAAAEKHRRLMLQMSPEMSSLLKALERFAENVEAMYQMRRAARSFLLVAPRRAFTTWAGMREEVLAQRKQVVWLAAQRGHRVGALQEMFEELKEPALIDDLLQMTDDLGMTPLLWASKRGFADIVEVLLTFAGDLTNLVGARDAEGSSSLHHASRRHHNAIVAMLLDVSCNVNLRNEDQSTALHWAARKDNGMAIKLLLQAGADVGVKNKWGATALDNAMFARHHEAIMLLSSDAEVKREAGEALRLERKLRPTAEERARMLVEEANTAVDKREKSRRRMQGLASARQAIETARNSQAKAEKRQRAADTALSRALLPAAARRAPPNQRAETNRSSSKAAKAGGASAAHSLLQFTAAELAELERCVGEAAAAVEEAGEHAILLVKERLAEGQRRLSQVLASGGATASGAAAIRHADEALSTPPPPLTDADAFLDDGAQHGAQHDAQHGAEAEEVEDSFSSSLPSSLGSPSRQPSSASVPSSLNSSRPSQSSSRNSHRSPGNKVESPMERQLRKARIKAKKEKGASKSPAKRR